MHDVLGRVARLARRDRRLRAAASGAWAFAAASVALVLFESVVAISGRPAPGWSVAAILGAGAAAVAAASVVGARSAPTRSRFLLEVDARLGLDARLCSLCELVERGGASGIAQRLARDIERRSPDWRSAVPVPRRVWGLALGAVLALAAATVLAARIPPAPSDADRALAPSVVSSDALSEDRQAPTESAAPALLPKPELPSQPATETRARSLSDILSDLRPALASAASTSPSAAEDAAMVRQELARLRDQLNDGASLSERDVATLHRAAEAVSSDVAKVVDDAAAASDTDALRAAVAQLLASPVDSSRAPADAPAPTAQPPSTAPAPSAPPSTPSSGATTSDANSGAPPPPDVPLSETNPDDVAPVAAPLTLGEEGSVSTYVTQGVPIESPATGEGGAPGAWSLSPGAVSSVLESRDLPAGTVDTIREYFQRITEENP